LLQYLQRSGECFDPRLARPQPLDVGLHPHHLRNRDAARPRDSRIAKESGRASSCTPGRAGRGNSLDVAINSGRPEPYWSRRCARTTGPTL
jgi:hypothetical protein